MNSLQLNNQFKYSAEISQRLGIDIASAIQVFFPLFVQAGDYALSIQREVKGDDKNEKANAFSQALTDADLTVQSCVEMATLASFPSVKLFSEEHARSLNFKYFPNDSVCTITLDPINGTKFYKDGLKIFDIIMTFSDANDVLVAIDYLPAFGVFYFAFKGHGAFCTTRENPTNPAHWRRLAIPQEHNVIWAEDISDAQYAKLADFSTPVNVVKDYDASTWDVGLFSIFHGKLVGFLRRPAPLIDWGALGFIAKEAGASVSDFAGNPLGNYLDYNDFELPNIVVSRDASLHKNILEALRG